MPTCPRKHQFVLRTSCPLHVSEPAETELPYIFYHIFFELQIFHLGAILRACIEKFSL